MRVTRRRHSRRLIVLVSLLAMAAGLLLSPGRVLADQPPPNPSDQQLNAANAAKSALADQVGSLSAQVASLQSQLLQLQGAAQLAEQKVALAEQQLQDANTAAAAAAAAVAAATAQVTAARQRFTDFVRTTFMAGGLGGTAGQLLTAPNPEQLLTEGDYVTYTANHQLDAIGSLDKATIVKSNADASARGTVLAQQAATAAAAKAEQDAQSAVASTQSQQAQVNATLASQQTALQTAQANLASLNGQRAAYDAYQAQQAAIAAAAAAAAEAARQQAAAQAAAARQNAGSQGVGSGNGGAVAVAPTGGNWSAAAGQTAVNRAMAYLGWPYSFAAGNRSGPTYGVAVDFDSRNDPHVYGFDCSGLTLYGWAPYLSMAHYAATQYIQAGSYHPSTSNLMPGDLVFWSGDGTVSGIGHVAMYVGGGNVIQAPFSGAYIEITPLDQVESGYYGATRPLT